jgi:hypothetical protein
VDQSDRLWTSQTTVCGPVRPSVDQSDRLWTSHIVCDQSDRLLTSQTVCGPVRPPSVDQSDRLWTSQTVCGPVRPPSVDESDRLWTSQTVCGPVRPPSVERKSVGRKIRTKKQNKYKSLLEKSTFFCPVRMAQKRVFVSGRQCQLSHSFSDRTGR